MVHRTDSAGGRHQRKIQRRSRQIELGIVGRLFLRRQPEYFCIEFDGAWHAAHIERNMGTHGELLSSAWAGNPPLTCKDGAPAKRTQACTSTGFPIPLTLNKEQNPICK